MECFSSVLVMFQASLIHRIEWFGTCENFCNKVVVYHNGSLSGSCVESGVSEFMKWGLYSPVWPHVKVMTVVVARSWYLSNTNMIMGAEAMLAWRGLLSIWESCTIAGVKKCKASEPLWDMCGEKAGKPILMSTKCVASSWLLLHQKPLRSFWEHFVVSFLPCEKQQITRSMTFWTSVSI